MAANAQYAADAAATASRLIAAGEMNANPTCAEAVGVATRMQPRHAREGPRQLRGPSFAS